MLPINWQLLVMYRYHYFMAQENKRVASWLLLIGLTC